MLLRSTVCFLTFCFSPVAHAESKDNRPINPEFLTEISIVSASPDERIAALSSLISMAQGISEQGKLELVNQLLNQIPYRSDEEHWGRKDYWATPLETLISFGADCEVRATARDGYRRCAFKTKLCNHHGAGEAHMVLTYSASSDSELLILDNLTDQIELESARKDLIHRYSFNASGLWGVPLEGPAEYYGASEELAAWKELRQRLEVWNFSAFLAG